MSSADARVRLGWSLASVAVLAVVMLPWATGHDGFPLSNYPMFAAARPRQMKLAHVVGIDRDGVARPLAPRWLGTPEVMQAAQTARQAARDPAAARQLCARVAAALREADEPIRAVEIRTDRYDVIDYWAHGTVHAGELHARCEVDGGEPP
ncbi:MAG: hypothetical protein U0168_00705 [Nannocystaceae bacterium]